MKQEKKKDKKILKLILNIKKCSITDLQLFVSLCLIRFSRYDETKYDCIYKTFEECPLFQEVLELARELNSNDNIHYLLS